MKTIRPLQPTDESLVYSTWLKGQRNGNTWFKRIEQEAYYQGYKHVIAGRLANSVSVACCLEADPDVVLGYAVFSQDRKVLHWVYVKKAWRKMGIAKELVPSTIETVSSLTRLGDLIIRNRKIGYNPFV